MTHPRPACSEEAAGHSRKYFQYSSNSMHSSLCPMHTQEQEMPTAAAFREAGSAQDPPQHLDMGERPACTASVMLPAFPEAPLLPNRLHSNTWVCRRPACS